MASKRGSRSTRKTAPEKKVDAQETTTEETKTESTEQASPETQEETQPVTETQETQEEPKSEPVADTQSAPQETETQPAEDTKTEEPLTANTKVSPLLAKVLEEYVSAMKPTRPVTEADIANNQRRLRGAIINAIVEAPEASAVENVRYILDFIHRDTTDTFSVRYVFRGYETVRWNVPAERKEMETLMTLFLNTADPKGRGANARRLDWDSLARYIVPTRAGIVVERLRRVYGIDS